MDEKHQKLEKFIGRILEIQNQEKSPILKTKDLKNIVLEMGMTETDWQLISETFNGHAIRGRGFLEYKNWEDAIKEFEQAHTLNPYNTDILYGLAVAHKNLWLQNNMSKHKLEAIKYATACIQIAPEYKDAIALISELKLPITQQRPPYQNKYEKAAQIQTVSPKSSSKNRITILVVVSFGLFLFFYGIIYFLFQSNRPEYTPEVLPENQYGTHTQPEIPEPQEPVAVPMILFENEHSQGLTLITESLKLEDYTTSYAINGKGFFELKGIEVSDLKIKYDILNPEDKVIMTDIISLVSDTETPLRNGDRVPFYFTKYVKDSKLPPIKAVRFSVNFINKQVGNFTYEPSKTKEFIWAIEKPSNFDIAIRERTNSISSSYGDSFFHRLVLEIENAGNLDINLLQFQIQWFNKQNKVTQTEEFYVTIESYSPIKRQKVYIYDRMFSIKGTISNFKNYQINVISIN